MDKRKAGLLVALLALAGAYVWMMGMQREAPLEVQYLELPGSSPTFSFNDDVVIRELMVVRKGEEPAAGEVYVTPEDEVVWHLVPRPPREDGERAERREARPIRAVAYGRWVRGLRRAPGTPRRGAPLEAGATYRFTATLDEGQIELEFSPGGSAGS
ncbi:MAG: hypothetical protein AAF710_10110 [Planctomycetota bacterium]